MDAITYGQLMLVMGSTAMPVLALTIWEEAGRHGRLSAALAAEEGAKDYLLYEEGAGVSLYIIRQESLQPLFAGVVTRIQAQTGGGYCVVSLEAVTGSYQMDLYAQNRSFQDTAMTAGELVRKVMESYAEQGKILFSIPDKELGRIMVQYQETDWAFLNRILSGCGACACVDSAQSGICLRAGLADTGAEADWDRLPYSVLRDAAPADTAKSLKGQLCYLVDACDVLPLGEKVRFHNQELYIGRIRRSVREGLLVSSYSLYFPEGLTVSRYDNPFLGGVSINGTVTSVKRNRLQVELETDVLEAYRNRYFFPFSTVAASPDGSGWYCMPRKGDSVRIFFPTADESKGYAIANLHRETKPAQDGGGQNPDIKEIAAPDGKRVRFVSGGIELAAGDGKGSVVLTSDGQAKIQTDADIRITAGEELHFVSGGILEVTAGTQIEITNDAGGMMRITNDTVEINAAIIANN